MKNKVGITRVILSVGISILAVVGFVVYTQFSRRDAQEIDSSFLRTNIAESDKQDLKFFKASDDLDFEIEVSGKYQISEESGFVFIRSVDGEIIVGKSGTEFDNLEDYLLKSKNNLYDTLQNIHRLEISGLESINGYSKVPGYKDLEKKYFIYANYNVYLLYTRNPELYDDLDQIAKSFRYTPD